MLHITTIGGSRLTIDTRLSNLPEKDVAITLGLPDGPMTLHLTSDEAQALVYDLTDAIDAAGEPPLP